MINSRLLSRWLIAATTTLALGAPALADEAQSGRKFFLAGAGASLVDSNYVDRIVDGDSLGPAFGLDLFVGIAPTDWFSIRGGWRSLGLHQVETSIADFELDVSSTFIEADLLAPISERILLGITAGQARWEVDETVDLAFGLGAVSADVKGRDAYYGITARVLPPESKVTVDLFARRMVFSDAELTRDLRFTALGAAVNLYF